MMTVIFLVTQYYFWLHVLSPFQTNPNVELFQKAIIGFTDAVGGGARGLLIGVALGTLLTGLRILFGIDRPYGAIKYG